MRWTSSPRSSTAWNTRSMPPSTRAATRPTPSPRCWKRRAPSPDPKNRRYFLCRPSSLAIIRGLSRIRGRLMNLLRSLLFVAVALTVAVAQNASQSGATGASDLPKLEHFDLDQVDKNVDPCTDFYKYACGKWMAANPIPPDQAVWTVDSPLQIWNETVLRETLEKAQTPSPTRSANDQRIGDYYASCMNEKQVDSTTTADLKPELERIAAVKSKKDLAAALAHLHETLGGAWAPDNDQTD